MQVKNNYIPTPTQEKAHRATQRYKLFGGAMGGGKSKWLCEEIKELSMQFPGNRGVICRYHLSDFKNSTLKTLLETIPQELILNHNLAEHTITLVGGSEIIYLGLSEEENVSKLKSMELGWFAIDEASEIQKNHFLLFQSRLRRRLPNGSFPKYYGLLASNPDDCWLKDDFVLQGGGSDYVFIPSLPKDNPFLPLDYEAQLRKTYPEDWVKRFLEGSWDDLAGGDTVIPSDWIRSAINRTIVVEDKKIISCDVARFGDDEIVIQYGNGNMLLEQDISHKQSLMETVGRIITKRKATDSRLIMIDDIGVGGGVTDALREQGENVYPVNVGEKSEDERFRNLKTQMWWHARDLFQTNNVSIINDPILIRQLGSVKFYYLSNGKIAVEAKDDTKKRLGTSPDRADAFVQLLWGSRMIVDESRDFNRVPMFQDIIRDDYGWNIHQPQDLLPWEY
jgi:phage terminase large subunit